MAKSYLSLALIAVCCAYMLPAAGQSSSSSSSSSYVQTYQGVTSSPSWEVYGRNNPLGFFMALGHMDLEAQKRYLKATGAEMQRTGDLACNVFGGAPSCMSLSPASKFHELCPNHDLKVDCAYYTDDEIEVEEDPTARFKHELAALGLGSLESACPTCFNNQGALWCAQTVPKCGSYSATVENVLLPALSKVTQAQALGQSAAESLAAAMPQLLAASSLAMPCRQMCEAVVSTCSCSQEQKFGPLLEAYVRTHVGLGQALPAGFTTQLFGSVYNTPLCSLYGNSADPNFAGTCQQLPTQCEDTARWCGTPGHNSTATQLAQELMAGQLANALFGWVDAPANDLFSDERSIINAAGDPEEQNLEEQYRRVYEGKGGSRGSSAWAAVAHWTVFAVCIAAAVGAGVAFWQWRQRQNHVAEGYLSMAALDDEPEQTGQPMMSGGRNSSV